MEKGVTSNHAGEILMVFPRWRLQAFGEHQSFFEIYCVRTVEDALGRSLFSLLSASSLSSLHILSVVFPRWRSEVRGNTGHFFELYYMPTV